MKPGDRIEIRTADRGTQATTVVTGHLKSFSQDVYDGEVSMEVSLERLVPGVTVRPDVTMFRNGERWIADFKTQADRYDPPDNDNEEESDVYPKATLVYDRSKKSVNIHLEADAEIYLTADGDEEKRDMGEEMPIYATMPAEILVPILNSARRDLPELFNGPTEGFRVP